MKRRTPEPSSTALGFFVRVNRGGAICRRMDAGSMHQQRCFRVDDSFAETAYRPDVNLDHVFDDKDTLTSKRLFCLTSPASFSCSDLVAASLKDSKSVSLAR